MRLFFIVFFCLSVFSTSSFSQNSDTVKQNILSALSTPLPITVIGPLITRDVAVVEEGAGFRATLDNALLMGIVPLGSLSFKITPEGTEGDYRITEFSLPKRLDIFNAITLEIGSTAFDGIWSTKTRSYNALKFQLNDVTVLPSGLEGASVKLGAFALDVDKEGVSGARESRFSLSATDIASVGMPTDDLAIKKVIAELKADGRESVDLYAVISRFIILSAMQRNQSALLKFAESLRTKNYDAVSLQVTLDGFAMKPTDPSLGRRLTINQANAAIGIVDMSPDEWGEAVVSITGNAVESTGYADFKAIKLDAANYSLSGAQLPIGATLAVMANLDAMANGQTVRMKATDLIDGFLNFGRIEQVGEVKGITFLPLSKKQPQVRVESYYTGFGLKDFRDNNGRIEFKVGGRGLSIIPGETPDAVGARVFQTLNPKRVSYDLTISDLNEGLLRKLMEGLVISTLDEAVALVAPATAYAMAMKPVFESKDARFVSSEIDAAASGKVRFYPAWVLGPMSYEGETKLSLLGYDKLIKLLDDLQTVPTLARASRSSDRTAMAILKGTLGTMKALSKSDGEKLAWDIQYPEAGTPLLTVNGIELRFPDFSQFAPLLATAGMAGMH